MGYRATTERRKNIAHGPHEEVGRREEPDEVADLVRPSNAGPDFSRLAIESPELPVAAEQSLRAAEQSAGQPLPDPARTVFEDSLGTDLSAVRVHTGGSSADAADSINARAYAVGQQIHFGPNQFDPSAPAGLHLLAHEVAHTQQQRAAATDSLQPLPVVPNSHRSEADADRAAGLMLQGAPAATGAAMSGVQRSLKDSALDIAQDLAGMVGVPVPLKPKPFDKGVGDAPAQAVIKGGANSDVKVSYDGPTAGGTGESWGHAKEPDSQTKTLTVERGRSGTVTINVHTWWHSEGVSPQKLGEADSRITARFSADEDGAITVTGAVPQTGGGGDLVEAFTDGTGADGSRLFGTGGVKQVLSGSDASSKSQERSSGSSNSGSKEVGLSGGIPGVGDLEGKKGSAVGHDKKEGETRGNTTTVNTAGSNRLAFNREVQLVAGPRKPAPPALTIDNFAINHSRVPGHGVAALTGWWAGLDEDAKAGIRNGTQGVRLTGHADKPGPDEHNLTLSNDRAKAVQKVLEKIVGAGATITLEGLGETEATGDEKHYDASMRKVDVTVFNKKKS